MQQQSRNPAESPDVRSSTTIAGADGCRGGWVIATRERLLVVPRLAEVEAHLLGVDMPIGLPIDAPRACDVAARRFLGPRRASVFPTPARACLGAVDHPDAMLRSKRVMGRGLSLQAFHLLPKIAEVDALVDPSRPDRIVEIHPECAFAMMRRTVLSETEPLPRKASTDGVSLRREILAAAGFDVATTPRGAAIDDVLDAYAVLWSAERFARGDAVVLGDGAVDARGLPMRIVV